MPAVHMARHAALGAHAHGDDAHCHGDAREATCHEDAREGGASAGGASHGAGSLEHRDVAALAPPDAMCGIERAPIAELIARAGHARSASPGQVESARARAPPLTS